MDSFTGFAIQVPVEPWEKCHIVGSYFYKKKKKKTTLQRDYSEILTNYHKTWKSWGCFQVFEPPLPSLAILSSFLCSSILTNPYFELFDDGAFLTHKSLCTVCVAGSASLWVWDHINQQAALCANSFTSMYCMPFHFIQQLCGSVL